MYRASRFALSSSLASRLHYDGLLNCLQLSWKLVSQEHLNNYPFLHSATWQRYCWVHYQVNLLFLFLWREHEVLVALHSVTRSSSESFQFFPRDIGSPLGYLARVVKELTHNDYYDLLTRIARAPGTPKGYLCREERIGSFLWRSTLLYEHQVLVQGERLLVNLVIYPTDCSAMWHDSEMGNCWGELVYLFHGNCKQDDQSSWCNLLAQLTDLKQRGVRYIWHMSEMWEHWLVNLGTPGYQGKTEKNRLQKMGLRNLKIDAPNGISPKR